MSAGLLLTQNTMNIYESRLRSILDVVNQYLPPGGTDAKTAMGQVIALVDPWPAEPSLNPPVAQNEMERDMDDRELLELAAKAAGAAYEWDEDHIELLTPIGGATGYWDPLTDDGDALRLAVKLNIQIAPDPANSMACAWLAHESDAEPIEGTIAVEPPAASMQDTSSPQSPDDRQ